MASKSYPHPVLNNRDDISGKFKADLNVRADPDNEKWIFTLDCHLENATLESLIKSGDAGYLLDIESPNCFYRSTRVVKEKTTEITLLASDIRDKVSVQVYIVALRTIDNYLPSGSHSDYAKSKFTIVQGDILADAGIATFPADPLFDPMAASADSFIKIDKDPRSSTYAWMDTSEDTICIYLPKKDWALFENLSSQDTATEILHSAILLPMLTAAISDIQNPDGNTTAVNVKLSTLLSVRGLMDLEPEIAAQRLLGSPISRTLVAMNKIGG